MGLLDRLFNRTETVVAVQPQKKNVVVGADGKNDIDTIQSFIPGCREGKHK